MNRCCVVSHHKHGMHRKVDQGRDTDNSSVGTSRGNPLRMHGQSSELQEEGSRQGSTSTTNPVYTPRAKPPKEKAVGRGPVTGCLGQRHFA